MERDSGSKDPEEFAASTSSFSLVPTAIVSKDRIISSAYPAYVFMTKGTYSLL